MYEHLRGTLDSKNPAHVVIDVNGLGYGVAVSLSTFERLPSVGSAVRLYTVLSVREDAHRLFGFHSAEERTFFLALTSVSGVGPAVALGILSALPVATLQASVVSGDSARLRKVKGVGKRLSERLVVELRDRMREMAPAGEPQSAHPDAGVNDAVLALEKMGFSHTEAAKAIRTVRTAEPDCSDSGELVRLALRVL